MNFQSARWIAPCAGTPADASPRLRAEFVCPAGPRRVILRIAGLGDYDASINGRRVAPTGLNQPWSVYEKTLYYREFDVTDLIVPGLNCLGVTLGASFWHNAVPPAGRYYKKGVQSERAEPFLLLAEVVVEESGAAAPRVVAPTGPDWTCRLGPVVFAHLFAGEDYDARLEEEGWDRPGGAGSGWQPVRVVEPALGALVRQQWPGFDSFERFAPAETTEVSPGVWGSGFAQNCSAQLALRISGGQPGQRIVLRCGEHRDAQGRLFGTYIVEMSIVTAGRPIDYCWGSFYLGFQFVEIAGAVPAGRPNPDGLPVIESVELVHVRTAAPEAGSFHCSEPLYEATHRLIDWAIRSNMSHVLTDCPHREKLGWLEVAHLMASSMFYRYRCGDWFEKIARDIDDSIEPDGRVCTVAPNYPAGRFPGAMTFTPEWGAAAVLLPWEHYVWHGEVSVLQDHYATMTAFSGYLEGLAPDGIVPGGLGDWLDYGHDGPLGPSVFTPPELTATAIWALCVRRLSQAARVLGRDGDTARYDTLHKKIATAFLARFRDPATGGLQNGGSCQCANSIALCAELVPAALRASLVDGIIDDLARRNWQQTPGDVGHLFFIRALAQAGRSDVLHRVYLREEEGSYAGILAKGMTALPETWNTVMNGTKSLNHCMLGHLIEWLYGYVAGLRQETDSVGWREILIAPTPGPLHSAAATILTPRGELAVAWEITDEVFTCDVTVPEGAPATLVPPRGNAVTLPPGKHHHISALC
jgi:alpha-L-rhamnosidase